MSESKKKKKLEDRFWYTAIGTTMRKLSKKHLKRMKSDDFLVVKEVYERSEGSWSALAEGNIDAWQTLRKACKSFLKVRKKAKKRPFDKEDEEKES